MEQEAAIPKALNNIDPISAVENVPDIQFFGDLYAWKLICKASSKAEGWMKSTKAMHIPGLGCLVQVTTQQGNHISEAVTFVPGAIILEQVESPDEPHKIIGRSLSSIAAITPPSICGCANEASAPVEGE